MFYLKIFLTHLDYRWRLAEIRTNYFSGSNEKYIDIVNKYTLIHIKNKANYSQMLVNKVPYLMQLNLLL